MRYGILAGLLFAIAYSGSANALEKCRYQTRLADVYFENLPREIKGWVNCEPANLIYVSHGDRKSTESWSAWVESYQKILNPEPAKLVKLREKNLTGGMKALWFESRRSLGATRHLLILKPHGRTRVLAFIQSANIGTGSAPAFTVPKDLRKIVRAIDASLLDREFPLD